MELSAVEQALLDQYSRMTALSQNAVNASMPGSEHVKTFRAYADEAMSVQQYMLPSGAKPNVETGLASDIAVLDGHLKAVDDAGKIIELEQVSMVVENGVLKTRQGYQLAALATESVSLDQLTIKNTGELFHQDMQVGALWLSDGAQVRQGFLKNSAVDPAVNMLDLLEVSRTMETYQSVIRMRSEFNSSAFENIGSK